MGDATGPSCNKIGATESGACVDGAGMIDDDGSRGGRRQDKHCSKKETNRRQ